jgi:hypothetical protein
MLALTLQYGMEVHERTPIPVPIPALEAAVKRFEPGQQHGAPQVLQRMFREALLNRNAPFSEKREIFQLLADLAQKDRALAIAILKPLIRVGLTISHTLRYDLPGLIGLLVDAGANIHERNNAGHDLLEISIASNVSLPTIEAVLKALATADVPWRGDVCLHYAMQHDLRPLAEVLFKYGGVPSDAVETWFFEHGDVS